MSFKMSKFAVSFHVEAVNWNVMRKLERAKYI